MIDFAIIIPSFNERETIHEVAKKALQYSPNVIVIDDGSMDRSTDTLKDLPILVICNAINSGKDASLIRGFSYAISKDVRHIITMDGDGQHNPDDLPRFMRASKHHPDYLIVGARITNKNKTPFARRFANKLADFFISWAAGQPIIDTQSGFRVYPVSFLPEYLKQASRKEKFVLESKILIDASRHGIQIAALPIASHHPENMRKSHFKTVTDSVKISLMILGRLAIRTFYLPGLVRSLTKKCPILKEKTTR